MKWIVLRYRVFTFFKVPFRTFLPPLTNELHYQWTNWKTNMLQPWLYDYLWLSNLPPPIMDKQTNSKVWLESQNDILQIKLSLMAVTLNACQHTKGCYSHVYDISLCMHLSNRYYLYCTFCVRPVASCTTVDGAGFMLGALTWNHISGLLKIQLCIKIGREDSNLGMVHFTHLSGGKEGGRMWAGGAKEGTKDLLLLYSTFNCVASCTLW